MTVWLWLRLHKHLLLRPLFFFFFSRFLFWCGPFFKGFIVTILFLFYVFVFWPCSVWDLSSPTRDWTHTPCIGRQSLNHCTARKIPPLLEVCWALPLVYWDKILSFCFGGWSGGKEHKLIRTFFFFLLNNKKYRKSLFGIALYTLGHKKFHNSNSFWFCTWNKVLFFFSPFPFHVPVRELKPVAQRPL